MPVPKKKQELYGKIVGHMQNLGKSLEEAKNIADRAIKHDVHKTLGIPSKKKTSRSSKGAARSSRASY